MKLCLLIDCTQVSQGRCDAEGGLHDAIDLATEITRQTFLRRVCPACVDELRQRFGYSENPREGLTMAGDHHITYHKSKFEGQQVYFLQWSGIEYIFSPAADRCWLAAALIASEGWSPSV